MAPLERSLLRGGCMGAAGCAHAASAMLGTLVQGVPESLLCRANTSKGVGPAVLEMGECLGLLRKLAISFPVHENWQLGTHIRFANCHFVFPPTWLPGLFVAMFVCSAFTPSSGSFSAVPWQSASRYAW